MELHFNAHRIIFSNLRSDGQGSFFIFLYFFEDPGEIQGYFLVRQCKC
jgi:hypothetical protein